MSMQDHYGNAFMVADRSPQKSEKEKLRARGDDAKRNKPKRSKSEKKS